MASLTSRIGWSNQPTVTISAIQKKANRKKNAPSSLVALAKELGVDTTFVRSNGRVGNRAPSWFIQKAQQAGVYHKVKDHSKDTAW